MVTMDTHIHARAMYTIFFQETIQQAIGRQSIDPEEVRRHGHRDQSRVAGLSKGFTTQGRESVRVIRGEKR